MNTQNFRLTAQEQESIVKSLSPGLSLGASKKNLKKWK
jgi:hypothetical protein